MTVNLSKGQAVDLTKEAGGDLKKVEVTINWNANTTSGADFDPDVVAFICDDTRKAPGEQWGVFFGNPKTPGDEVVHSGDDRKGGTGETITVDLEKLPPMVNSVMFSVAIYHAKAREQNFGSINGLTITVTNVDNGEVLGTSDLSFEDSLFTALNFGELVRRDNAWGFRIVGEGYNDGLKRLFEDHGIAVGSNDYDEGTD